MKNKLFPILASGTMILAILACNLPGGQVSSQPDLAATITAQAVALQALSATPAPVQTLSSPLPNDTPQPADTALPAAPSKPKNFDAKGSAAAIAFSWNDTSLNETGFRIYQDGVSAPITSIDAHPATGGMSYNWPGLACGFKGKFSVRAYNDAGESASSNTVNGVTIPCPPAQLIARGQGNAISFNWTVGTGTHNEDGFHIYQQGVPSPVASRGPNLGAGGTNFDLPGQLCNLVATYSVTAFNSAGESPASNLVQAETIPCGPSGLTLTSVTKDHVTYTWTDNATNETGYHVYIDDKLYVTLPGSSPFAKTGPMSSDAAVQCDFNFPVNHVYSIKAFNLAGESTSSEHVGATTPQC